MEFLAGETEGRIFSAYFQKADGTMRQMTCRRNVKRYLRGGELPYNPLPRMKLPVWDLQQKDYRMVSVDRLVSFNIGGETFVIV